MSLAWKTEWPLLGLDVVDEREDPVLELENLKQQQICAHTLGVVNGASQNSSKKSRNKSFGSKRGRSISCSGMLVRVHIVSACTTDAEFDASLSIKK